MKRLLPVIVGSTIVAAGLVVAGPLNPPAGPVASSYKTLSEVEPRVAVNAANTPGDASSVYKITQPGSYYLTGNVTGQAGKSGVLIASSGVSLDLGGFTISGGSFAVHGSGTLSDVSVRNGRVTGTQEQGVSLSGVRGGVVEGIGAYLCGSMGVYAGEGMIVRDCTATECYVGFAAHKGAHLSDCVSIKSIECGFYGNGSCLVMTRCTASESGYDGFVMASAMASELEACVALEGEGSGFSLGYGTRLIGCKAILNAEEGVWGGYSCVVEGCIVQGNGTVGIAAYDGTVVRRCVVDGNTTQGIQTRGNDCTVAENQVRNNGAGLAGIWINSSGCRVEDNRTWGGGFGVYVDGADNIVVRNSCRGSTNANFWVGAGNEAAPVVTNPGASGFATATAWSNFSY